MDSFLDVGDTFCKNGLNNILYGQDRWFWRGLPVGVVFTVKHVWRESNTLLCVAPGYGGEPYGNGPIHIWVNKKEGDIIVPLYWGAEF